MVVWGGFCEKVDGCGMGWYTEGWPGTKLYEADIIVIGGGGDGSFIYEVNGARQETYTPTEFTAHTEYICPWPERYLYKESVMGSVFNAYPPINAAGNVDFSTAIPSYWNHYYPAVVTQVSIAPLGPEGVTVTPANGAPLTFQPYTVAKLSVDYKGRARAGNATLQETVTPSLSARTLPSWGYYWRSDGSPVLDREAPGLQEVKASIQRHLTGIRRVPSWFFSLAGCVNYNPWTDLMTNISYLPETLLFIPTTMERQVTMDRSDDDFVWDISYEIMWNPVGWNNFRRPHGVDCMMYNGEPVVLYTVKPFETLLVNPNAIEADQMMGEPYRVHLVDNAGMDYYIGVAFDGTVVPLNADGSAIS